MIIRQDSMKSERREQMRGGAGSVAITHIVDKDAIRHARLFSRITLGAGDEIGPHVHEQETEYYYIISGEGVVTEDDGEHSVSAGDVVVTGNGASHSIRNSGSVPLVFVALIILD